MPNKVNITFQGKDGDKIISLTNEAITSTSTTSGIFNFAITDNIISTPENPAEVTVVVSVDGSISSSAQLFIASPGASTHAISLANINNKPEGVESNETLGSANSDGATDIIVAESNTADANAIL